MKELKGLEQLSCDVADLMPALGLIQNYISCLQLELKHAKTSSDRSLILYSLDQNCGFDNIKDVLVATEENWPKYLMLYWIMTYLRNKKSLLR